MSDIFGFLSTEQGNADVTAIAEVIVPQMNLSTLTVELLRRYAPPSLAFVNSSTGQVLIADADDLGKANALGALSGLTLAASYVPVDETTATSEYVQTVVGADAVWGEILAPKVPRFSVRSLLSKILDSSPYVVAVVRQDQPGILVYTGSQAAVAAVVPEGFVANVARVSVEPD